MCGIIGYIGHKLAMPILLEGLLAQEYRGYDSAGIALLEDGGLRLVRAQGKIAALIEKIRSSQYLAQHPGAVLAEQGAWPAIEDCYGTATVGIGHTRWATHGKPSDVNAHPHLDGKGEIALVHNGIIENYLELKEWLADEEGHSFASETDTEVLPHLLEHYYLESSDLLQAMRQTIARLRGAYATVAISKHDPRKLVAARQDSPLVIGIGEGEYYFASDIAALVRYTDKMLILQNGDIAEMSDAGVVVYHDGQPVERELTRIDWDFEQAAKGGYPHFMIKEIHEQSWSLSQTLQGRIADDHEHILFKELDLSAAEVQKYDKISIVACGTAYHAGLVAKNALEKLLRLPVEVDIASEFRYRDPFVDEKTLLIVISQSGETADTRAALREGKAKGATVIAVCNVVGSSIAQEADSVLYTWAGPEIAVASTKAYITQLMVLYMLAFYLAERKGSQTPAELKPLIESLYRLPEKVDAVLRGTEAQILALAERIKGWEDAFFIGRGIDYAVAMEGALKLKEISYIHAEAYAAGELKHGTIALIVPEVPVLALCTQQYLCEKMVSNIKELQARQAYVIGLAFEGNELVAKECDETIFLPATHELLSPILSVIPLQLLAYHTAALRNCEIDQPRNLAKSVTVE